MALRKHFDDGVHTYRIPALATTTEGTLLCVYDMRRRRSKDLQEDIDIGLVRSTDGGNTWEAQRIIMDMGTYGGHPQEINGVSDPGIIVDPASGEIFCFGVWMVGKAGKHQWEADGSEKGFEIGKSAQMLLIRSKDDGKSWSKPKNMTRTWKKRDWILYVPSPQQGIALQDGTLVMPTQGRNEKDENFSNLLVSKDHGKSWTVSAPASIGNSESQAVQLSDGSIMLNMRTEGPKMARTVAVTRDLGKTWTPHETNRKTLIEPHCNGSLYRFDYVIKGKKTPLLLFANPHSIKGRHHQSIQVSLDEGKTWPAKYRLLLDEGNGAGYPSLSRVDEKHIGIVYEGSQAHVVFEKVAISELLER
jgi:sialidase-1